LRAVGFGNTEQFFHCHDLPVPGHDTHSAAPQGYDKQPCEQSMIVHYDNLNVRLIVSTPDFDDYFAAGDYL
jgi:hypothetical protein